MPKIAEINLEDLAFYFDSVVRDRLDSVGIDRKSGEVLVLREKLVRLSDAEFDATIKTINTLVGNPKDLEDKERASKNRRIDAMELFDRTKESGASSQTTPKISAV